MTYYYLPQYKTTSLNVPGGVDASQTTGIIITDVNNVDITKPGILALTYSVPLDTTKVEFITYTSINGSNELVGVTRGTENFSAKTHNDQAVVAFVISASHINELATGLLAVETTLTSTATLTGAQTLTNKTLTSPKIGTAIMDTNGNEVIKTPATGSAVNEVTITNAATGNGVLISATGDDTNINLNLQPKGTGDVQLLDGNGNEVIKGAETASAVNEVTVTNAATGGTPSIAATGGDTNIHLAFSGKGNGLVKTSVLRKDISTDSYAVNQVTLTGWGFISTSSDIGSVAVGFGVTFATAPIVVISGIGYKSGSDPSAIGDFSNDALHNVAAAGISTTGFTAYGRRIDGGSSAGYRYGFAWTAIGTLN